jgi:hypothetical protein
MQQVSSAQLRVELSRLHFRSAQHWIDVRTGDLLDQKLFRDLLETVRLFPFLAASFSDEVLRTSLRSLVEDVRDLVLCLQGHDLIYPFTRSSSYLTAQQLELFLDNHVPVKLNRLLERLLYVHEHFL